MTIADSGSRARGAPSSVATTGGIDVETAGGIDDLRVDAADFPIGGGIPDVARFVVRYAVLAPSTYNTQPWQFRIDDSHIDLYLDESRGLPVVDPDDREMVISCGAALLNLRLALAYFGYWSWVNLLPRRDDPSLLARVLIDTSVTISDDDRQLFSQIARRHTNRARFDERLVPRELLEHLAADAGRENVVLHVITDSDEKAAIGNLVGRADREQLGDRRFRRELASWLRTARSHRRDGMHGAGLGPHDVMTLAGPFVVRTFDLGNGRAAFDEYLAGRSPVLAMLGTAADDQSAWLRTGQALERILLRCTAHGVGASFLNQPVEVEGLRPRLAEAFGGVGYPQILLRLGYGRASCGEPRRRVDDVLIEHKPA